MAASSRWGISSADQEEARPLVTGTEGDAFRRPRKGYLLPMVQPLKARMTSAGRSVNAQPRRLSRAKRGRLAKNTGCYLDAEMVYRNPYAAHESVAMVVPDHSRCRIVDEVSIWTGIGRERQKRLPTVLALLLRYGVYVAVHKVKFPCREVRWISQHLESHQQEPEHAPGMAIVPRPQPMDKPVHFLQDGAWIRKSSPSLAAIVAPLQRTRQSWRVYSVRGGAGPTCSHCGREFGRGGKWRLPRGAGGTQWATKAGVGHGGSSGKNVRGRLEVNRRCKRCWCPRSWRSRSSNVKAGYQLNS